MEGRRDLRSGKTIGDKRAAANVVAGQAFRSLAYSADGALLLAGGHSKLVCLYDVAGRALLRRFPLSKVRRCRLTSG